ncbi:MAG: phenylalanine--tRNA ligase subunit beta [Patescibacteria group bacterium]|nr:phenylalanine--tRNA ligase subunit beta [Patescibacteria group bacterium]
MNYSYKWLKDISKTEKTPEDLTKMIGLKGFELERSESLAERFKNFVVGEIISLEKHPNADKLQLARVDIGEGKIIEIVCGAWNIKKGDKVPVALPGSILPQNKLVVEKKEVRGVVSNGMLCAEDELGLGKDYEGIMILNTDSKPGQTLVEALDLADTMIELDVLPNRAHDCLSHEGMAREIRAMEDRKLEQKEREFKQTSNPELLNIRTEDEEGCPRYIGAVLKNVKIKPSPIWIRNRLIAGGMEPINNIVDITNYVMLEIGNPLHAFDCSRIEKNGVSIIVRKARKGERLELLDETNIDLDAKDIVIADEDKALALAGIKGGKYSGISDKTTDIILEAANFNRFHVRKSRQRHALSTESQTRFEKGLSPILAQRAMARAVELLKEHAGADLVEIVDIDASKKEKQSLKLHLRSVKDLLGYEVSREEITATLSNLGFETNKTENDKLEVLVPYWRLDIEGQEDLIEEVSRIVGYEKIPETALVAPVEIAPVNLKREFEWKLRNCMISLGFDEVTNYSFYGQDDIDICGLRDKCFQIENPLSHELSSTRVSLVPGILKNVSHNKKHYSSFSLFELGRIFHRKPDNEPKEFNVLTGAVYDEKNSEDLFYDIKGRLEELLKRITGSEARFESMDEINNNIYHLTRTAKITANKKNLGFAGEVNPQVLKNYGIKKQTVVFEINFETLYKLSRFEKIYKPLRKYPEVLRDISMFVDYKTEAEISTSTIKRAAGDELIKAKLFDVYIDKDKKRKSLAYHLVFGKDDGTLTSDEIDKRIEAITAELEKTGAEVRKK